LTRPTDTRISRRRYLQTTTLASVGLSLGSLRGFGQNNIAKPLKRHMGRLDFEATTLGLGGQASLQWTPPGVDATRIILKAFALGLNYFDTSNAYGPSQSYYGKAFRELRLIPGEPGYNETLRRSIFLTSKTGLRWAKGGWSKPGMGNFSNGPQGSHTVDDIKRSLSLIFGDGKGAYPKGAWLDQVLVHHIAEMPDVDAVYEGLHNPDPRAENIGALAALVDYRDGSNLTGLNPKGEKLIRHIGFSGHHSPAVMMEMIQRDDRKILEGMLVTMNANDRLNFNMQYNVVPLAAARNMGVIAMKVFADGCIYTARYRQSNQPDDVVLTVGNADLPSRLLVEHALTTPGIHTLIVGTGHIDDDPRACQLQQNLAAAQVTPDGLSHSDRRAVEKTAASVKDGKTNYFQAPAQGLTAPRDALAEQHVRDGRRVVRLTWQTAYAGDEPLARYEIWRDRQKVGQTPHEPQAGRSPFVFEDAVSDQAAHMYSIAAVDAAGRSAATGDMAIQTV